MKTITIKFTDREYKAIELAARGDTQGMLDAQEWAREALFDYATSKPRCRVCGCTDDNCEQCIEKTGEACRWVTADLCSACWTPPRPTKKRAGAKR